MVKIGIFILATGRKAGGPETYEVQLIRGLSRIDKQNQYFIYCTSVEAEKIIGVHQPNVTYRVLRPAARAISVAITLPRWMASDGLDFFHSTYAPPPLPNKPFVFTMHCASNFEHPEFYPTFIRWRLNGLHRVALRRAGFFLCVSNFVARYLKERVKLPAERLAITYHGVGAEFSLACRKDARRILAEQIGLHQQP